MRGYIDPMLAIVHVAGVLRPLAGVLSVPAKFACFIHH
jgi:hypothetical protein